MPWWSRNIQQTHQNPRNQQKYLKQIEPKTKKCQESQNTKIIIIKKSIKIILMKGSRYPLWGLSFLLS